MGKMGAAMRAAKMDKTKYTFTKAELMAHDQLLLKAKREQMEKEAREMVRAHLEKEFEERCKLFNNDDDAQKLAGVLNLLMSFSIKVLVEKFGWKKVPKKGGINPRLKILRFADALSEEISDVMEDEHADIREISEKVYERYGIKFRFE